MNETINPLESGDFAVEDETKVRSSYSETMTIQRGLTDEEKHYEARRQRTLKFAEHARNSLFVWARGLDIKLSDIPLAVTQPATAASVERDETTDIHVMVSIPFTEEKLNAAENICALRESVKTTVARMVATAIGESTLAVESNPHSYFHECVIVLYCAAGSCSISHYQGEDILKAAFVVNALAVPVIKANTVET